MRSLFVIGAGVVSLTTVQPKDEIEFLRLGPGDHFGEIGMLTGRPAEVTLKALVPVTTYELAKETLAPVLEARPECRMSCVDTRPAPGGRSVDHISRHRQNHVAPARCRVVLDSIAPLVRSRQRRVTRLRRNDGYPLRRRV